MDADPPMVIDGAWGLRAPGADVAQNPPRFGGCSAGGERHPSALIGGKLTDLSL